MSYISALIVIALGAFAIYCDYRRPAWYPYAKGLPIVYLLVQLAEVSTSGVALLIFIGLFFGLAGDLLLLKKKLFLFGLAAFLAGHLFYVWAFAREVNNPAFMSPLILPLAVFGAAMSAVLFYYLWRASRKAYLVPVLLYIVTICFMVVFAVEFDLGRYGRLGAFAVGALFFAVSDSLLAINRFVRPFATAQLLVLSSYYAAQLCIARGVFDTFDKF